MVAKGLGSKHLSKMREMASWEDDETVRRFLASQLEKGRLSLVMGAGVSMGYGLPDWDLLVKRIMREVGTGYLKGEGPVVAADRVFRDYCGKDEVKFADLVSRALYKSANLEFKDLQGKYLLAAIAALTLRSYRGKAASVVSFNFDDLVERYLRFYGFSVKSVATLPTWRSKCDVRVLHPHGILAVDSVNNAGVVFTESQYDKVVGAAKNHWRRTLIDLWSSTTCLFIGLSGDDPNLRSVLEEVRKVHCSRSAGDRFWGVRLALRKDPRAAMWTEKGVFHHSVTKHEAIAFVLFDLCQRAEKSVR